MLCRRGFMDREQKILTWIFNSTWAVAYWHVLDDRADVKRKLTIHRSRREIRGLVMARDFHSLYFQLENIKNLVSKNLLESAKKQVTQLLIFYEDAELDGAPYEAVSSIINEAYEINEKLDFMMNRKRN